MAHVQLDASGNVVGIFGGPQPGDTAVTDIPDNDPRVLAFLSPVVPAKPQQITATQFLNRMPPAVLPVLWTNAQTGVMLMMLAAATMIDLTDPGVQGGINALVPGILTAAQALAILDH
jgi:hypothetical protein